MLFSVLNSGSNGNCYYIGDGKDAILVDAGLSAKQIVLRTEQLGLDIQQVRAIFISHEHSDHIFGIKGLYRKFRIPVYMTGLTRQASGLRLDEVAFPHWNAAEDVEIGRINIRAFPVSHDAADPHNFIIRIGSTVLGIFTDLGYPCDLVKHSFNQCHIAVLETNYDEVMLAQGPYPLHLQNRISGPSGHLSNLQALELFRQHRSKELSHLFLAHLSNENNTPEKVLELFRTEAGNTEIVVTSRSHALPVLRVGGNPIGQLPLFA